MTDRQHPKFKARLRVVFDHAASTALSSAPPPDVYRFVPRSLNGGPGWAVWDRKLDRFLNADEVMDQTVESLRDERWPVQ